MKRTKLSEYPVQLSVEFTNEDYQKAEPCDSQRCLIAEALLRVYGFSNIRVIPGYIRQHSQRIGYIVVDDRVTYTLTSAANEIAVDFDEGRNAPQYHEPIIIARMTKHSREERVIEYLAARKEREEG